MNWFKNDESKNLKRYIYKYNDDYRDFLNSL